MSKHILYLNGLDCAHCAGKIESDIQSLSGVKKAELNFVTKKLSYDCSNSVSVKDIEQIVHKHEPDITIETDNSIDNKENILYYNKIKLFRLGIGVILFLPTLLVPLDMMAKTILYLSAYLLIGGDVLIKTVKSIGKLQFLDENFLMALATIGALVIGEYPEAVAVMLFYQVGEYFQNMAVHRSRKSIKDLMDIRPDTATVFNALGQPEKISAAKVKIGDIILVKAGEKIPLDGIVYEGNSMLDTSALTGESILRSAHANDEVLSGFINKNGVLKIKVTKGFEESTASKILDMVENASQKKAATENFITKFAHWYTPSIVICAILLAFLPPIFLGWHTFEAWFKQALIFLVVSCPCALVISIPLSFFGGIGKASKCGILIKGSNYLEALNHVDTVVMDKTGTLTKGVFQVTQINSATEITNTDLLAAAAHCESMSTHPIALSILYAYGKEINPQIIKNYKEYAGLGISAEVDNHIILAGNQKFMKKNQLMPSNIDMNFGTTVHIAIDGTYAGNILIADELKEDAVVAVKNLKQLGIKNAVMLTGDSRLSAEDIAKQTGIDTVYSELLPNQKVQLLEQIMQEDEKGLTVFTGDGINDAPSLSRSDVGIAMGGLGSDAAIEAADIVIMNDRPSKIADAIRIARYTRHIVTQCMILALSVKAVVLILSVLQIANMWEAVFADVGVSLLAILNSMRILRMKI